MKGISLGDSQEPVMTGGEILTEVNDKSPVDSSGMRGFTVKHQSFKLLLFPSIICAASPQFTDSTLLYSLSKLTQLVAKFSSISKFTIVLLLSLLGSNLKYH